MCAPDYIGQMFQITSNLLYLCASLVAWTNRHVGWSIIMLGVTACSTLYHAGSMPRVYDVIMAFIAFGYGCVWYFTRPPEERQRLVPILTLGMIGCLAVPKPDVQTYNAIHPWAHVLGGLASVALSAA